MSQMGSFVSIGGAWAEVASTPRSYLKLTTYAGGTLSFIRGITLALGALSERHGKQPFYLTIFFAVKLIQPDAKRV